MKRDGDGYNPEELNGQGQDQNWETNQGVRRVDDGSKADKDSDGDDGEKRKSKGKKNKSGTNDDEKGPDAEQANDPSEKENDTEGVGKAEGHDADVPLDSANRGVGRAGAGSDTDKTSGNDSGGVGSDSGGNGGKRGKGKTNPFAGGGAAAKKGLHSFLEGAKTGLFGGAHGIGEFIRDGLGNMGGNFTKGISRVVGATASAIGISRTAAGVLCGALVVCAVGGGGIAISGYVEEQRMMRHEMVVEDDCAEDVEAAESIAASGNLDPQMEENAAKAWAVYKALGLTDEQAAGAIGNMQMESGLSPFTMECDFITAPNEKWGIGPIKQGFIADLNSWTLNKVFPYYTNIKLNKDFYNTSKHGYVAGVGMFGFTGMHYDSLEDWAAGLGYKWWDEEHAFDIQMSFIIAPGANGGYGGPGGASEWLANWGNDTSGCGTPRAAAEMFCRKFEGVSIKLEERGNFAEHWYQQFKGTTGDRAYGESILEMAQANRAGAAGSAADKESDECVEEKKSYDNSDLARAITAYAYRTKDEGRGNDGTELYQAVHRAIFPGDPYFQSCDRGVSTAVRWAGADDNFPAGPCTSIIAHCQDNPDKWEYVGKLPEVAGADKWEPGDVLVCTGHVVMYVGNEIIKEKFPDAPSEFIIVSASLNERSPGCEGNILQWDNRDYSVYRLKEYEENGQYVDVVKGQNLKDR